MSLGLSIGLGVCVGLLVVFLAIAFCYILHVKNHITFPFLSRGGDRKEAVGSPTTNAGNNERNPINPHQGPPSQPYTTESRVQDTSLASSCSQIPTIETARRAHAEVQRTMSSPANTNMPQMSQIEAGRVLPGHQEPVYENLGQESHYVNLYGGGPPVSSIRHEQHPLQRPESCEEDPIYEEPPPEGIILASDL